MSTYTDACTNTAAFRSQYSGKVKRLLLTAGQIQSLLAQVEDGLDGVAIYLTWCDNDFGGVAVGVQKDQNGNYNDVNISTGIVIPKPCPTFCGGSNALNS